MGHGDLPLLRQALEEKVNAALNSTAVAGSQFDFHQFVDDIGCGQSPGNILRIAVVEFQAEVVDVRLSAGQLGLQRRGLLSERLDLVGLSGGVIDGGLTTANEQDGGYDDRSSKTIS